MVVLDLAADSTAENNPADLAEAESNKHCSGY